MSCRQSYTLEKLEIVHQILFRIDANLILPLLSGACYWSLSRKLSLVISLKQLKQLWISLLNLSVKINNSVQIKIREFIFQIWYMWVNSFRINIFFSDSFLRSLKEKWKTHTFHTSRQSRCWTNVQGAYLVWCFCHQHVFTLESMTRPGGPKSYITFYVQHV